MHEWIVTVDHKKLGLMYIGLRNSVPGDRRPGSHDHADPACHSQQSLCFAAGIQPIVHHARHDHGVSGRHAAGVWFRELFRAPDDRGARHGFSAPECVELLDERSRRAHPVFQLYRRRRTLRGRERARHWLVRLRAAYRARLFSGTQHRLLDHWLAGERLWQPRHGAERFNHDLVHALSRA